MVQIEIRFENPNYSLKLFVKLFGVIFFMIQFENAPLNN